MKKVILILSSVILATGLSVKAIGQNNGSCETILECAQKAMEAAFQAKTAIRIAVPKGAIMAFNLSECPDGWDLFAPLSGRVALGAGVRPLGESGGAESHQHGISIGNSARGPRLPPGHRNDVSQFPVSTHSHSASISQNHNMPPFHVLTYCERK